MRRTSSRHVTMRNLIAPKAFQESLFGFLDRMRFAPHATQSFEFSASAFEPAVSQKRLYIGIAGGSISASPAVCLAHGHGCAGAR